MGFMDKIRNFLGKTHEESSTQARANDAYKKRMLAEEIVDLVGKIRKINSFDSSINSFSHVSSYELQQRDLEASKWTGRKPQNMSTYDYDRMQRDDDGR